MRQAAAGTTAILRLVPGAEARASAIGNTGVDVVSSPWLVGQLEEASHRAVRDLYDEGEATVGVRLALDHLAPAWPGIEVVARARLLAIEDRRLRFEVDAHQGQRLLMRGTHERVVVRLDRFLAAARSQPAANPPVGAPIPAARTPIEFYFDFHSPWCWFASLRIEALASRTGRTVSWRPFHLARLIERIDGRRPLDANPAFVRWYRDDMQQTARELGLTLRYHPRFPLRPSRALRAAAHAAQHGRAGPFVRAVMAAYWSEGGDIEDVGLLGALGERCGLDAAAVGAATAEDACRREVDTNTDLAIERGAFGAPTFVCDGQLFWGNDRMDRLEAWAARG